MSCKCQVYGGLPCQACACIPKKKIEMGKKYVNGRGKSVRILCVDRKSDFPVVGLLSITEDYSEVQTYTSEGQCFLLKKSEQDLVEVKEKKVMYMPINKYLIHYSRYSDYEAAEYEGKKENGFIAVATLTWEE